MARIWSPARSRRIASGAVPVLAGLGLVFAALALVAGFLILFLPGKTYVFVVEAATERIEVDVTHPAVSRIALLNATEPRGEEPRCLTGEITPSEGSRVEVERRGNGAVRLVLITPDGRSAGQFDQRSRSSGDTVADLAGEAVFKIEIDRRERGSGPPSGHPSGCESDGTVRAALEGPLEVGEEVSAAGQSAARLSPGTVGPHEIKLRTMGRSWFFGTLYELGALTLPPDARLRSAKGLAGVWSTTLGPAESGGLAVQATTTARELRVYSATSPTDGEALRAKFFAVLFNDPDISVFTALAVFFGGVAQVAELLRKWLELKRR